MKYISTSRNRALFLIFFMVVAIMLIFANACTKNGENSNPIKIGINNWAGYDPLILADKTKLFIKNNVRVEIKRFASTTQEMEAMKEGDIQGAGLTLDEFFSLVADGFKGKVVLVVDYSMGGDMIIGQKEMTSITELEGKTIGYEGTVVGEFLLHRALKQNHIKRSSIKLIDVQADQWLSTFKEKSVDALVCFNPVATSLLKKYEGNLLFSSADIPFEIIDVLIFSESFYDDNKVAISNILKAWFDALSYIDKNPDNSAEIISTVKKISPYNYKQSLNDLEAPTRRQNLAIFDPKSNNNIYKHSQVIINFMISRNMISKRIETNGLFTPEALLHINPVTQ